MASLTTEGETMSTEPYAPAGVGAQAEGETSAGGGVQGAARTAKDQVQEKAASLREQAEPRVRDEIDRRSTQAGEQVRPLADAFRRSGEELRGQGKEPHAKLVESVADRADRASGYLTEADADRVLGDLEDFGRRRPWVLAAGGAVVGFLASRFLKASSGRRYEAEQGRSAAPPTVEFEPAPPLALDEPEPPLGVSPGASGVPTVAPPDAVAGPAAGPRTDDVL